MKVSQLFENVSIITAYHVGRKHDGKFDVTYAGTSTEGSSVLGPGIYFTNNKNTALGYADYYDNPWLYEVKIDIHDLYISKNKPSERMVNIMNTIAKEIGYTPETLPRDPNYLKNGRGFIGQVVNVVGKKKAQELFIKHGLTGSQENIDTGIYEYCIFDTSVITLISKEPLSHEADEKSENTKPDLFSILIHENALLDEFKDGLANNNLFELDSKFTVKLSKLINKPITYIDSWDCNITDDTAKFSLPNIKHCIDTDADIDSNYFSVCLEISNQMG